jgi:PAS domain S-box-containing protein
VAPAEPRRYGRVVMQRGARPGHTSARLSARVGDARRANLRILPPPRSALPPGAADALVLARIHDAVFATDLENRVTFWAPSAEQLFGYLAAEAVGRTFGELIPSRIDAPWADASDLQATVAAGQTWRGEGSCLLPDGRELWVESTVNRRRAGPHPPAAQSNNGSNWASLRFVRAYFSRRALRGPGAARTPQLPRPR